MPIPLEVVAAPDGDEMFWKGLGALWVFSAAVSALSPPNERSSPAYRWLFTFGHLLAANLDRVAISGFVSKVGSFEPSGSMSPSQEKEEA